MESLLLKLEADIAARKRGQRDVAPMLRTVATGAMLLFLTFQLGAIHGRTDGPGGARGGVALERTVENLQGEIELQRNEIDRMQRVFRNSAHYGIGADLAAAIEEIALAESVDPRLAFELVRVESRFNPRAVSAVGALGLTQLMPETARWLQPGITRQEIFDRDTNLRLGMRFYKTMLERYDGNTRLALYAYNRGPGIVDRLLAEGRDPSNGYAKMILGR